ncbi:MAG: hypothetical protein KC713_03430 [Candidatus Omnitrophica bacterium]|nr:hypothetical protein [Candidatus Omnitrophota bacterium]
MNDKSKSQELGFKIIPVEPDLRLKKNIFKRDYLGVIRSQVELTEVWSRLMNIQRDYYQKRRVAIPAPPVIDFDEKAVLWYGNHINGGGPVRLNSLTEYENFLIAEISVIHSHTTSDQLNLWEIPVTNKEIIFREIHFQKNNEG